MLVKVGKPKYEEDLSNGHDHPVETWPYKVFDPKNEIYDQNVEKFREQ